MRSILSSARQPALRPAHLRCFSTAREEDKATSESSDPKHADAQATGQPSDSEKKSSTAEGDTRDELTILYDAVLLKVPSSGWTDQAIEAAVGELGWSPAAKRMIARGPVQVAEQFVNRCNVRLAKRLSTEDEKDAAAAGGSDSVGRATFAIRERLEMIEPYHHNWARALALQALPQNSPRAVKNSALLIDEIAHYAGYRNPDVCNSILLSSISQQGRLVHSL